MYTGPVSQGELVPSGGGWQLTAAMAWKNAQRHMSLKGE